MKDLQKEYIYLDGLWLKREQLLQLAMNVGDFNLAEHYLCALLADAVMNGQREAIQEVNKVREHYGVKAIPLCESNLEDGKGLSGGTGVTSADEQARKQFLRMTHEEGLDVLRRSMKRLLEDYNLFIYARHWLAIFMVIRDRLMESLNQTGFVELAVEITPDGLPEKLRMREHTMKNFSREIQEPDRGKEYYRMKHNPQKQLCDTFWSIIQETILTEN